MSIPEWQRDMARAVGDDVVRSIVEDFRSGPSSGGPAANVSVVGAGTVVTGNDGVAHGGWREPPSIDQWRAPGINLIDRIVDVQDAIDRAARARELAEAAALLRPRAPDQHEGEEPKKQGG
jgi:hypothetical protein